GPRNAREPKLLCPPPPPEPEPPTDVDRPVLPREIQLVHRLPMEPRSQSVAMRPLPAKVEHVRRDVAAIHVEARAEVGDQQSTGSARDVECGLSGFDVSL